MRSMFFRISVAIFLFVFCAAAMSLSVTRATDETATPISTNGATAVGTENPTPTPFYPTFTPAPVTWSMVQLTDGPNKGKLVPGALDANGKIVFDKKVTNALYDAWSLARKEWYYTSNPSFNPTYNTMGAFGLPLPPPLPDVPIYVLLRGGLHKIGIAFCENIVSCTIVDYWYGGEKVTINRETNTILKTEPKPDTAHTKIVVDMQWDGATWKVVWGSTSEQDLLAK